jgi:hypothetical protein
VDEDEAERPVSEAGVVRLDTVQAREEGREGVLTKKEPETDGRSDKPAEDGRDDEASTLSGFF